MNTEFKRYKYYSNKWFIAYLLNKDYGEIYKYKPSNFKDSREILVQGGALAMNKSREEMLEFEEYKGKVYQRLG
jgi:hypothetical protein|tara:strand:+ start:288 stop:509 length:222 start_codon:yes stop_codon:yes gene_type:complete